MAKDNEKTGTTRPKAHKPNWDTLEDDLLRLLLKNPTQSFGSKQLLAKLELPVEAREQLESLLQQLTERADIDAIGRGKWRINLSAWQFTAKLRMDRDRRFWATIPELSEELAIRSEEFVRAFHGDTVLLEVERVRGGGKLVGRIVEVIQRVHEQFVGTIDLPEAGKSAFFVPQQSTIKPDFVIPKRNLGGATHGDKVLVELEEWKDKRPVGRVTQVLGSSGTHQAEMHAILMEFGLTPSYPEELEKEAAKLPDTIPQDELQRRRDFRTTATFTIDPEDAKDFDDAISFRAIENGLYEVGVHIADVTYYLEEGSLLDKEAIRRATSVYLVDRTIPMLPERLSNHLCSLVPNQDRLVFSAVFELDLQGNIHQEWFGRSVIHSQRRFTYEEAQQRLESGEGEFAEELRLLNTIAYALRDDRFAKGSIGFETDEVKFKLDENFKPVAVMRKVRKDAHKLIEDFMLLANRRVAYFVATRKKKPPKIPFVYRIHDVPNREKLSVLKNFVATLGYKIDIDDREKVSQNLNKLVLDSVGKPEEQVIQTMTVRSMPKAIYTTKNVGHYGLGFQYYSHFTSPIRRYPDVLAHRILARILSGNLQAGIPPEQLEDLCIHCSDKEKRAAEAERASIRYKQVEFLQGLIGEILTGMVSGVTEWGIFVELDGNKCEGMVPVREMHDDHYFFDQRTLRLVGRRTGRYYRIGDAVRIKVVHANLVKRQADFELIEKIN